MFKLIGNRRMVNALNRPAQIMSLKYYTNRLNLIKYWQLNAIKKEYTTDV
jgi:hypothetical protein